MPKNIHGGKGHKRGRNKKIEPLEGKEKLAVALPGQVYASVKKKMGGSRLLVECSDKRIRSAIIPGKLYKRTWMNAGDVLLVDLDTTGSDDTCTVNHKYTASDIILLKARGYITFETMEKEDDGYEFVEDENVGKQNRNYDQITSSSDESDSDNNKFDNIEVTAEEAELENL